MTPEPSRGAQATQGHRGYSRPSVGNSNCRVTSYTLIARSWPRSSPDPEQLETTALLFRTRQENPSTFQDRLEEIGLIFGDEELARQLELLEEYTRKQTAPAEASRSSPADAEAAPQASAADVARSWPTCSPDPEQPETTALLFRARQENPSAFQDQLQEIGLIFGDEELARQLELLEEYTHEQTAPAEASGSSPVEAAAAQQASPADVSPNGSKRAERSPRWALTIRPPWCRKILDGSKVWEIRGQNCKKHLHERICIAESGTGMLLGEMTIRDSFKITREDLEANRHLHGIEDLRIITYGNIYAWVLENAEAYEEPVPYSRSAGSIAWVDLRPATGEEACQNPDCCFGPTKKGVRGKAFARAGDEVRFRHCVFCSEEAFRAALADYKGQPIRRLLGQLRRTSADRHGRALEQIRQQHGPEMAERFAPKQPTERARKSGGRKKSVTSWETSLEHRQPALRASETARRAFEITEQRADARLQRKFPSLYAEGARSTKDWMPPRAAAFHKWCQEDSWQMCSCCGRMVPQAFRAKHATGKAGSASELAACGHCKSNGATGYWAPTPADVPRRLRKLSAEAVEALRPFDIRTGGTMRAPNGYLVHTCWCLAKSQRANSRPLGCGHVEMLMMLLSDLGQERKCDMVQNCRVQMTRPKNIHESPVQAPCKLKTNIFVKLGRVDIKRCCQVLNGVY